MREYPANPSRSVVRFFSLAKQRLASASLSRYGMTLADETPSAAIRTLFARFRFPFTLRHAGPGTGNRLKKRDQTNIKKRAPAQALKDSGYRRA